MIYRLAITFLIMLLLPFYASAALPEGLTIVISQIQVSGSAGSEDEFIEIKNVSTDVINLNEWSIQYKSATGGFPVAAKKNLSEFLLLPNTYFLIARTSYSGLVIPDLIQSSISMSGATSGGIIYLSKNTLSITSDTDPNIADRVAYGSVEQNTSNAPLPPPSMSLNRIGYSGSYVADFELINSLPRNSTVTDMDESSENETEQPQENNSEQKEESTETDTNEEPEQTSEDETDNTESDTNEQENEPVVYSSDIEISEISPNPSGIDSGSEWIELFNNSPSTVNIKDWIIDDDGPAGSLPGTSAYTLPDLEIGSGKYLKIVVPSGKFSLINSTGDEVRLFWPDKNLVDKVSYTGPVKDNETWCLLGNSFDWCEQTPGLKNKGIQFEEEEGEQDEEDEETGEEVIDYSEYKVVITSVLADPDGPDSGNEIVTLKNIGTSKVDLRDWILDDGLPDDSLGSTSYMLSRILLEQEEETEIIIPRGKFSLNNTSKDGVRLFSPDEVLHDSVEFEKVKAGTYWGKVAGEWTWLDESGGNGPSLKNKKLPVSGLEFKWLCFVISIPFWYIVYGFRNKQKGTYEQTRSH
ncbi:MAG: lamin tail domain-containing protein [Candidatus Doudnabacteria bacterium]|nr:lamin tail domain-containing protein [Candidatus Doudnabacteria bacterium]